MIDSFSAFTARTGETDPLRALSSFLNYSKTELLKNGQLTPETENQVNSGALQKAMELGLADPPETEEEVPALFDSLFGSKPTPDLYAIQAREYAERGDTESAQKLRAYAALQSRTVREGYGDSENYAAALETAKADADPLFNEADAKRFAVRSGLAKIATFEEGGRIRVEAAPDMGALDDKSLAEYAAANSQFVSPNHLSTIRGKFAVVEGLGKSQAQIEKTAELRSQLDALMKTDPALAKKMETGTREFELENRTTGRTIVDRTFGTIAAAASGPVMGLLDMMGKETPQTPMPEDAESIAEDLAVNSELGRRYSKAQLKDVVQDLITIRGIDSLELDEKNPAAVARFLSDGTVALPVKAIVNPNTFESILKNLEASPLQKELLRSERSTNLDAYAMILMPQILEAGHEGLLDTINEGRRAGKSEGAILEEVALSPKYSGVTNRLENFGLSLVKLVTDLIPAVGAMLPDIVGDPVKEFGYSVNKKISDEMAANAALAGLTGRDFGWVQELWQTAPQVIADVVIARGAGKALRGVGTGFGSLATRLTPKTAERMTMFLQNGSSTAAGKAVREITEQIIPDANMAGMYASQGARVFGSTYTGIRTSLEAQTNADGSPKYTAEQIDTLAVEAGLLTGVINNLVTAGFNRLAGGRFAGTETLAAGTGFSRRALQKYYDDIAAGTAALPDDLRRVVMAKGALPPFEEFADLTSRSILRQFAEGFLGEASEEFLQTVGEDVIEAITTKEDFDLVQTSRNAGLAAWLGGLLGGGAKLIQVAETEFLRDPQYRQADFESIMLTRQIESLRAANAPATADFLQQQLAASQAKKQTIRQQFAEYTAERRQIETDFAARQKEMGALDPVAAEEAARLGLPAPVTTAEEARVATLTRQRDAVVRKITEAEAAVPEEQRSERQSMRLQTLRETRDQLDEKIKNPPAAAPEERAIVNYVPPRFRNSPAGAFVERLVSEVAESDRMDDDAVINLMDEASMDFGLPETDTDIDERHAAELKKVLPVRNAKRFAKSATPDQISNLESRIAESRNAYKSLAEHNRMLAIQKQSVAGLESKIAEAEAEPTEQRQRIATRYREQLAYVQRSIAESEARSVELRNAVTESLNGIRDTVNDTQPYLAQLAEALRVVEEKAVEVVEKKKAARAAGKPAAEVEAAAAEDIEVSAAEIEEMFGVDVAQDAAAIVQEKRSGRRRAPAATPAPAVPVAEPAPAVPAVPTADDGRYENAPPDTGRYTAPPDTGRYSQPAEETGDYAAPKESGRYSQPAEETGRYDTPLPPVDESAPAVTASEQELAAAIATLQPTEPSALEQELEAPEPKPVTPDEIEERAASDAIVRKLAEVDRLRAQPNKRKITEARNKVYRERLNQILEGNETVEYVYKGKVKEATLLRDVNDPASFITESDFDLFHELLEAGTVPKDITWLNARISYKHADYNLPFRTTLQREVEKRYPVRPYTPPEQLYSKEDLKKAMDAAKFERGGMVTPRMEDFLNDYRSGMITSIQSLMASRAGKSGKGLTAINAQIKALNKRLIEFDNDVADVRQFGSVRKASTADRAIALTKLVGRIKQAGEVIYKGLPITLQPDGTAIGIHTNNPYDAASLIERGISILVPKAERAKLNPAIEINRLGYVKRVRIAEAEQPIERAGDRSRPLDSAFKVRENDPDYAALVAALPRVKAAHIKLMGNPFGTSVKESSQLREEDFIQPLFDFFNKGGPKVAALEETYGLTDAEMSDFQNAVVVGYLRALREFSLAVRIKEAALAGKVMPLMRSLFIDRQTKELTPSVRKMLRKMFPKVSNDNELLAKYAMKLDSELTDAFTVPESDGELDGLEAGDDAAFERASGTVSVSERWLKAKGGRIKPAGFMRTFDDMRRRFADGWSRRSRMMKTELVTETGEERAISGGEQTALELEAALESNFLSGDVTGEIIDDLGQPDSDLMLKEAQAEARAEAVQKARLARQEDIELKPTGNPEQDNQMVRILVQRHGALIDKNPLARAAFEKLMVSYGFTPAAAKEATGVELLELARNEHSALREQARARLEQMIAKRATEIGDPNTAREQVSAEFTAAQTAAVRSALTPDELEAKIQKHADDHYVAELSYYSSDAREALESNEARVAELKARYRKQAEVIVGQWNTSAAREQNKAVLAHVEALAQFVADANRKTREIDARLAARTADILTVPTRLKAPKKTRILPNGGVELIEPLVTTLPPLRIAPPITLPTGAKMSRMAATKLLAQYRSSLEEISSRRPPSFPEREFINWKDEYSRTARFIKLIEGLLSGKKKFFTVGTDISDVFYATADPVYDFTDNLIANTAQLEELGLEAGNNRSIVNALKNVPRKLKPVADMLLARPDILASVKIEIVTMPNTVWAGKYLPDSNTVVINRAKSNGRGVADVLAHELIHAATVWAIRNPDQSGAKALIAKLDSLRRKAQEQARKAGYTETRYTAGLESLEEFVAYTFTSADFQRMLREIDSERGFFRRAIDAIASFFGVRNDSVTALLRDMTSLVGRANMKPYGSSLSEDIAADMDAELLMSVAEDVSPEPEPTPEPTPPTDTVRVINDETLTTPMEVRSDMPDTVFVNPVKMQQLHAGLPPRDAKAATRKLMAHELAHLSGLQALTDSDISDVAASLSNAEYWNIADQYYSDTYADPDTRLARIAEDRQSGVLSDTVLAHEFLRMQLEKFTTGTTTEEDLSFYRSNPNMLQRIMRYLSAAITKLRMRIESPFDSQVAASLNRALQVYHRLNDSDQIASSSDAIAKIADGEVLFLHAAAVPTTYEERGKWKKWFSGEFPKSVKAIVDDKGAHNRVASRSAVQFERQLRSLAKAGKIKPADAGLIRAAMGGLPEISSETRKAIRTDFDAKVEAARAEFNRSTGTQADRDLMEVSYAIAKTEKEKAEDAAYDAADRQIRIDMQAARNALPKEVVTVLDRMRKAIDEESAKLVADPHLPDALRLSIDNNLGIYLTQSYRAFTTKGWFDMLKSGGVHVVADEKIDFDKLRENALKNFARQAETNLRHRHRFSKLSKSALDAKVRDEVGAETQQLFDDFIYNYEKDGAGLALIHADPYSVWKALLNGEASDVSTHTPHSDSLKQSRGNLLARQNIPPFMREMLGEITDPMENAVRTLATVNTLAANQQMLTRLREAGLAEGWLVNIGASTETDPAAAKEERARALREAKDKGYVMLGRDDSRVQHLNNLYGPAELKGALDHMFNRRNPESLDAAEGSIRTMIRKLRNLAGLSMGVKTMLSIGKNTRDFFSDILFFGPMQFTLVNPFNTKRWSAAFRSSFAGLETDEKVEAHLQKMIRLNVLDNDANTTALRQMFRAFRDGDDESLHRIREALFDADDQTEWRKLGRKIRRFSPLETAAGLSNTIGAHLKLALYEKELRVLNEAYPDRMVPDTDGFTENEKRAAYKTGETSRTNSNVYPIAKEFSRSEMGSLLAPFAIFKAEVMRIMLSTPKLAFEEIKSENSVERNRGMQRLSGFLTTLTISPLVVAGAYHTLFAALFGDDDDKTPEAIADYFLPRTNEELARDAALRAGLPYWQKGNSVSFAVIGDKVRMLDLTFINPLAVWTDGLLRSIEHIRLGELEKVPAAMARWAAVDLVGEQIAAGAVVESLNNKDDKGMPISVSSDPFYKQLYDRVEHVAVEGYMPPVWRFGDRLVTGTFGSSEAGTAEGRMANRLETALGELAGARPRAVPLVDLFARAARNSHAGLREVRTVNSIAASPYPQSSDAVEDGYNARNRALVKRGQELQSYSEQYGKLGLSVGEQLRTAREVGISKKAYLTTINGYAEAYKPTVDDMRAIYEARVKSDGPEAAARVLKFLADKTKETGPLLPLNR